MIGDGTIRDDYDRACQVEGWAGVISNGPQALALVLADNPLSPAICPNRTLSFAGSPQIRPLN